MGRSHSLGTPDVFTVLKGQTIFLFPCLLQSFVEHSHYSLWYFFDLRGFLYTTAVIRMQCVCVVNVLLQ